MADQRVIPMFSYEDVGRAADWISEAFGFSETGRWSDGEGRVTHVNMELDGGLVMLGYPSPDYRNPKHHAHECEQARKWSETPFIVDGVHVSVDDIDSHYSRAQAAGARILSALEDNPGIGQRQYRAEDIEGHRWMFASRQADATLVPEGGTDMRSSLVQARDEPGRAGADMSGTVPGHGPGGRVRAVSRGHGVHAECVSFLPQPAVLYVVSLLQSREHPLQFGQI